ncbi:DNA polymerase-4 [Marininema mesophilum]|uniref:DNA polymerase-4 n=1 Tax=Marininema mesophilum TaxID=1048340 RepID=A0A1H2T407_9BACL|nr:hypothetical protein [Marininema mesophilum]SDW38537.1 DNA polymerase-4 [Marininema mesophilum]
MKWVNIPDQDGTYDVYRNGDLLGKVNGNEFIDTNVKKNAKYQYKIKGSKKIPDAEIIKKKELLAKNNVTFSEKDEEILFYETKEIGTIVKSTGIPCSIGVGPNKLMAKMAAGMKKPRGLTVLELEDVPERMWPLPVKKLFGIGDRMERHFHRMAIRTIGDLAATDPNLLAKRFGVIGRVLHQSVNGIDYSPVDPYSLDGCKSIGHQFTLPKDYVTENEIKLVIRELAEEVCTRMRRAQCMGRTVSLTLRRGDFRSIHRSITLPDPTNIGRSIFEAAMMLFHRHWDQSPVRLIGITVSQLSSDHIIQLNLFQDGGRKRATVS